MFVTFIFEFEYNQTLFSHGPPFCPFWCSKYLNFIQKLTNWNPHHTFLENRDPEDTKNPYCFFAPRVESKSLIFSVKLMN